MGRCMQKSEQIRMTPGAVKNHLTTCCVNAVDEQPVRLNMTFPLTFVITVQRMIVVLWQEWLFVNKQSHYFDKLIHVLAAFFSQIKFLFKFVCSNWCKQRLALLGLGSEISQQFFKRAEPLCRDFAAKHGVSFLKGGFGFSIKAQFTGFRVAVFGAQGAVEGLRWRLRRSWFERSFFTKAAASRNIHSLCNDHTLNIAYGMPLLQVIKVKGNR